MLGIENYVGFVIAGVILNLTPGADTIYILTRSVAYGRKAGIYSVFGIVTGALIHTFFASIGLSVILAKSAMAFSVIKYMGATYLVYLGIKMLVDKNNILDSNGRRKDQLVLGKIYFQGLLTNLLNPKVALFFLAFIPQFINPQFAEGPIPFILLGLTFITTGTFWCLILVYSAFGVTQKMRDHKKIGWMLQKIGGMIFIGLGIKLLLTKQ
jgi:RhtB (resistance to homoserine/threonine) family protein